MQEAQPPSPLSNNRVRIVVATSVALTFISFWRAAAIVLNDLGSSAYYAAGIAVEAVGLSAPWLILVVMLFSFAVRAVYVESCSMFVRGGVYRVVKEALGGTLAKISVSMLIFDYILTGPISGVSAGQYIAGLINDMLAAGMRSGWIPDAITTLFHGTPQIDVAGASVVFALITTIYYWWQNIKGIEESSQKALRVMQITSVMVVILMLWAGYTIISAPAGRYHLPPLPVPRNFVWGPDALGWFTKFLDPKMMGFFGVCIAFGHSVLAMSGEETLAQVYREISHPKLSNLKRAAIIIAVFSLVFTGIGSLLAVMLITSNPAIAGATETAKILVYRDNMISGMAMSFAGPTVLKLLFNGFVVFCGFLFLSGAINTSIIGANGVLNRVSEDGILADWFRIPHKKFGTSSRIINMVVILQLVTIVLSRGDVIKLGEAYAFGVIWSFTFNSLSMLVLRFKFHGERGWKVPPNFMLFGREIPFGLACVHFTLLATALTMLFTKTIATKFGIVFALVFFILFYLSEQRNLKKHHNAKEQMKEHFQLEQQETVQAASVGIQPGNILVTVRDHNNLAHLKWVLQRIDTQEQDIVVLAAQLTGVGSGERDLETAQIFSDYEQMLFTKVVTVAESYGKTVSLVVIPARDVFSAIIQTANNLESSLIVAGLSAKLSSSEQAFYLGQAWEGMAEPKREVVFQVVKPDGTSENFHIGPHEPTMKSEDVHLVHRLWLRMRKHPNMDELHHSDLITLALTRLARDYGRDPEDVLKALGKGEGRVTGKLAAPPNQLPPPPLTKQDPDKRPDDKFLGF